MTENEKKESIKWLENDIAYLEKQQVEKYGPGGSQENSFVFGEVQKNIEHNKSLLRGMNAESDGAK